MPGTSFTTKYAFIAIQYLVVTIMLSACSEAFDNPCPDGDCSAESSNSDVATSSISSGSNSESTVGSTNDISPTAIGVDSSNIGISSNGTGSTTEGSAGGFSNAGSSNNTGNFENDYEQYDPYQDKFMVVQQLMDKVVETENYFVMQYLVSGEKPLKYQWFKKRTNQSDLKVGENQAYFYEIDTQFSHGGKYYVKVTDAKGNSIQSRTATLHVVQGRKPCDSGTYAPRYRLDSSGQLEWAYLYEKSYLASRDKWAEKTISPKSDSSFLVMSCSSGRNDVPYCNGTHTGIIQYQCQNGKFKRVYKNCGCKEADDGGGG